MLLPKTDGLQKKSSWWTSSLHGLCDLHSLQHIYAEGVFGTAANISIYVSSEYGMLLYSQTFGLSSRVAGWHEYIGMLAGHIGCGLWPADS